MELEIPHIPMAPEEQVHVPAQENPTPPSFWPRLKKHQRWLIISVFLVMFSLISIGSLLFFQKKRVAEKPPDPTFTEVKPSFEGLPLSELLRRQQENQQEGQPSPSTFPVNPRIKKDIPLYSFGEENGTHIRNLKIEIPQQQSKQHIQQVFAQTVPTIPIYPISFGQYSAQEAMDLAKKFSISASPTRLESMNPQSFLFKTTNKVLVMNAFDDGYRYFTKAQDGPEPTKELAVAAAQHFLQEKGYDMSRYEVVKTGNGMLMQSDQPAQQKMVFGTEIDLGWRNQPSWWVIFRKKTDKYPVYTLSPFTGLTVTVGPGNAVAAVNDGLHAYPIDFTQPQEFLLKEMPEALDELKKTGGLVFELKKFDYENDDTVYSTINTDDGYDIRDAVVTSGELVYYLSTNHAGNTTITDTTKFPFGYLMPVWKFSGTGRVYGPRVNGNRTQFTTLVYAFKQKEGVVDPFRVNFAITSSDTAATNSAITTTFGFRYAFNDSPVALDLKPERGLKYTLTVVYPNNEYTQYTNVVRFSQHNETIAIPTGQTEGPLTIYYNLTDFPLVQETRIVNIQANGERGKGSLFALVANTHYDDLTGYRVRIQHETLPNSYEKTVIHSPEHPDIPGLFAAIFENIPVGKYTATSYDQQGSAIATHSAIVKTIRENNPLYSPPLYSSVNLWQQL
ncbi:MAG: hypothetical protein A2804_01290 [Candidatus Pacebacteria bacterium RIFCSPHIGHO2_01_FULL_46_10]|nr:MAG: hypothetical protein A2804_01290 [Candidatus Pacebacteria bacterium RIFCSPHIGHO2_01_FULL_46_10]